MGLNRANTRQYSATAQPSMSRKDVRSVPPMQPTSMMYGIDMRDHLAACFYPELIHIQKTNTNTPNVNSQTLTDGIRHELSFTGYFHGEFSESDALKNKPKSDLWDCGFEHVMSHQRSTADYSGDSNTCSSQKRVFNPIDVQHAQVTEYDIVLGCNSSLRLTSSWSSIRKQMCNSIAKWCLMCDNAEHTVSMMKQSCPILFNDDLWESRCRRRMRRNHIS